MRLYGGFYQPQLINAAVNGLDRLGYRVALEIKQRTWLHFHGVVGCVDGSEYPVREFFRHHAAEDLRPRGIHAVNVDLDGIRVFQRFRVIAVKAVDRYVAGAGFFTHLLNGLIGTGFGGVLYLHLEHKMAAAFEVKPQMETASDILLQAIHRGGEADDSKNADEYGGHNHTRLNHQISLHAIFICLIARLLRAFGGHDRVYCGPGEL